MVILLRGEACELETGRRKRLLNAGLDDAASTASNLVGPGKKHIANFVRRRWRTARMRRDAEIIDQRGRRGVETQRLHERRERVGGIREKRIDFGRW